MDRTKAHPQHEHWRVIPRLRWTALIMSLLLMACLLIVKFAYAAPVASAPTTILTQPAEPLFAWSRVYPYLKPIALEVRRGDRPDVSTELGVGYRLGPWSSVTFAWKILYGKPDAVCIAPKLSFR